MPDINFHYIHTVNYTGNWCPSIQNDQNQNQNQNQNGLGTLSRTEPNIREKESDNQKRELRFEAFSSRYKLVILINPLVTRQKILSDLAEIYSVNSLYCP